MADLAETPDYTAHFGRARTLDELQRLALAHQRAKRPVPVAARHDGVHIARGYRLVRDGRVRAERGQARQVNLGSR